MSDFDNVTGANQGHRGTEYNSRNQGAGGLSDDFNNNQGTNQLGSTGRGFGDDTTTGGNYNTSGDRTFDSTQGRTGGTHDEPRLHAGGTHHHGVGQEGGFDEQTSYNTGSGVAGGWENSADRSNRNNDTYNDNERSGGYGGASNKYRDGGGAGQVGGGNDLYSGSGRSASENLYRDGDGAGQVGGGRDYRAGEPDNLYQDGNGAGAVGGGNDFTGSGTHHTGRNTTGAGPTGTGAGYERDNNDTGYGNNNDNNNTNAKPSMGQKIKGTMDEMMGKVTKNPEKQEEGRELRSGAKYNNA